jgi:protoheme IX farnesyltransferase
MYCAIAAIGGAVFLLLAGRISRSAGADRRAAHRLFAFSIFYLFALFAALLIDHGGGSFSTTRASHGGRTVRSAQAKLPPGAVRNASSFTTFSTFEV